MIREGESDAWLRIGALERRIRLLEHEAGRMNRELAALVVLQSGHDELVSTQEARIAALNQDRRRFRDKLRQREERLKKAEKQLSAILRSRSWRWLTRLRRLRGLWTNRGMPNHGRG